MRIKNMPPTSCLPGSSPPSNSSFPLCSAGKIRPDGFNGFYRSPGPSRQARAEPVLGVTCKRPTASLSTRVFETARTVIPPLNAVSDLTVWALVAREETYAMPKFDLSRLRLCPLSPSRPFISSVWYGKYDFRGLCSLDIEGVVCKQLSGCLLDAFSSPPGIQLNSSPPSIERYHRHRNYFGKC